MLTHVVVTIYTNPQGKIIVHTYGPYTQSKAGSERKRILDSHWWVPSKPLPDTVEHLRVVACRMLDVDAMNATTQRGGTRA